MIFGMPFLTFAHVLISVIGIGAGFIILYGFLVGKSMDAWNAIFLLFTVLTSVTGFIFFKFEHLMPSYILGGISLVILAIALYARYGAKLAGGWRKTYVITAMLAFWLNVFVLVAQFFMKIPALHALAPKGSEPPFLVAQVIVMIIFIILTNRAIKGFRIPAAA